MRIERKLLKKSNLILGIESSCDDTSVAVVKDGKEVLSNVISSQDKIHGEYGGVFPELAAREHIKNILPVYNEALNKANVSLDDIDHIAVTYGPGLIGSLLVGLSFAKGLALSQGLKLIPVHHIEGHIYSAFIENNVTLPAIALIVSGGHTSLIYCDENHNFKEVGSTLDDAVGETYDKVARMLDLGFPGGPMVDRLAQEGRDDLFNINSSVKGLDFSFSGFKTYMYNYISKNKDLKKEDVCASFQKSVVKVLMKKLRQSLESHNCRSVILGGGVAANSLLRKELSLLEEEGMKIYMPSKKLCLDNAAMIAAAGYQYMKMGKTILNKRAISRIKVGNN